MGVKGGKFGAQCTVPWHSFRDFQLLLSKQTATHLHGIRQKLSDLRGIITNNHKWENVNGFGSNWDERFVVWLVYGFSVLVSS